MSHRDDHDVAYRALTPADGGEINELFTRAYGRDRTLAQWRWEFTGPPGAEPVLWGARAGPRLVGHYALIPLRVSFFGQSLGSAKAESAMVDPDYRGRGICSRLVELTLRDAGKRGLSVVWGFPNEQSFGIMERSGRINIGGLYGYIKVLSRMRVFRAYLQKRWGRSGDMGMPPAADRAGRFSPPENPIDERFRHLWERSRERLGITIERSPEYLAWRFRDNPHGRYLVTTRGSKGGSLSGYMIATLKREGRLSIGYIVDFLCADGHAGVFDGLLSETLRSLEGAGADMVALFLNPAHPLCRNLVPVLAGRRFHRRKHPRFFSVKVFSEKESSHGERSQDRWQRWHRIENWYLTGAFGEGVEY